MTGKCEAVLRHYALDVPELTMQEFPCVLSGPHEWHKAEDGSEWRNESFASSVAAPPTAKTNKSNRGLFALYTLGLGLLMSWISILSIAHLLITRRQVIPVPATGEVSIPFDKSTSSELLKIFLYADYTKQDLTVTERVTLGEGQSVIWCVSSRTDHSNQENCNLTPTEAFIDFVEQGNKLSSSPSRPVITPAN